MREVKRPWGLEKHFAKNEKCTVKILEVEPEEELSLQYHKKRDEVWYFLTRGYVQIGKKKKLMEKDQLVRIKKLIPHRIFAKRSKVVVLEISFGNFSQKDEVRLEDKYGRK